MFAHRFFLSPLHASAHPIPAMLRNLTEWDLRTIAEVTSEMAKLRGTTYRDEIEKRMTPEQIAQSRKRAAEWKPNSSTSPGNGPTEASGVSP